MSEMALLVQYALVVVVSLAPWALAPWVLALALLVWAPWVRLMASTQAEVRGLAPGSMIAQAKARGSVTHVEPDAAQDAAQAQARAGGRGNSTGRSAEGGTPADCAQPAA